MIEKSKYRAMFHVVSIYFVSGLYMNQMSERNKAVFYVSTEYLSHLGRLAQLIFVKYYVFLWPYALLSRYAII